MPTPDGGVILSWDTDTVSLEIDVADNGEIGFLLVRHLGDLERYTERDDIGLENAVSLCHLIVRD